MIITVETEFPIAFDSPDHLYPWGTMRDNHTNIGFIEEIERYFENQKISFMDLGCAGGQLVIDFLNRGHVAVGLEGSNYSVVNMRANWPEYHNKNLFTCDISRPFRAYITPTNTYKDIGGNPVIGSLEKRELKFNCITAWEVLEHIHPDRLDILFENIMNHLLPNGIFVGSVSKKPEIFGEYTLHQSLMLREEWENIIKKYLDVFEYPFRNKVRDEPESFYILLKKR